ncbi:hypothetical protein SBOR_2869 [Sclerotinia borealis F-4128]|uniref:Uncharacterized protein n=1 Tax=Sclerotinia borealis (strain F-4128) TaxID=1432307 RepID=W9CQF3_SCLBF|nr:hypothetical protein SBOR_2869 [Sclerotinia borealis F-4128]
MVELDIEWTIDSINRRRSQNRIAQRKFRQSRKTPRTPHNNSNQPPSSGGACSTVETCSIAAPDFQLPTAIGTTPPDLFDGVTMSTGMFGSPTTGSTSVTSNNNILGIDDVDVSFIESLISRSNDNNSLSAPQIANSQPDFDQTLNFISLNTSKTPSASPVGLDYLTVYGTHDSISSNTHPNTAQHNIGSGHVSQVHPAMDLIPHDKRNSNETSPVRSSKETSSTNSPTEKQQSKGWLNPLHIAARRGHEAIVRTLLSHHIDCNETDSDARTALIHASIDGHDHVVNLLLAHGARISDLDRRGRSALYWATMNQHEAVLRLLLWEYDMKEWEQGIDAYDDMGWTALHIAIEKGFDVGVQLLLGSGASLHARARKTCNGDDDKDKDDSRIVQAG